MLEQDQDEIAEEGKRKEQDEKTFLHEGFIRREN